MRALYGTKTPCLLCESLHESLASAMVVVGATVQVPMAVDLQTSLNDAARPLRLRRGDQVTDHLGHFVKIDLLVAGG